MAFSYLKVFTGRRFPFSYISPAVCEGEFSSTGTPFISLLPINRPGSATGPVMEVSGGHFRFSWQVYPGALCYSVYKAVDEMDPFGDYVLVAECITDAFLDVEDPGCYRVQPITPDGAGDLTDPVCIEAPPPEPTPPEAETDPASDVLAAAATLNGRVIPHKETTVHFEWGVDETYGFVTDDQVLPEGEAEVPVTAELDGLAAVATYHYRIVATNEDGTVYGEDVEFITQSGEGGFFIDDLDPLDQVEFTTQQARSAASGYVVGYNNDGVTAFFWKKDGHSVTVIPDFGGTFNASAVAVNESGIIAGLATDPTDSFYIPYWFDSEENDFRNISAPGYDVSSPRNVISDGKTLMAAIVGGVQYAVLYDPAIPSFATVHQFSPWGMNESLQVLGRDDDALENAIVVTSGVPATFTIPGIGDPGAIYLDDFNNLGHALVEMVDFDTGYTCGGFYNGSTCVRLADNGGDVIPMGLNDSDVMVGQVGNAAWTVYTPCAWIFNGAKTDIPLLSGTTEGIAAGINSDNIVVGWMDDYAFVYKLGVTYDLMDFNTDPDWTAFTRCMRVTDDGVCYGYGVHNGEQRAFAMQLIFP